MQGGKQDLDAALAELEEAVRLSPESAKFHFMLGMARQTKGDRDGAIASLQESIRLDPGSPMTVPACSMLKGLGQKVNLDPIIAAHKEKIRLNPNIPGFRWQLGFFLESTGDLDGAVLVYREAILIAPTSQTSQASLRDLFRRMKHWEKAVALYRELCRLRPTSSDLHRDLADMLREQGKLDEAVAEYREAIRLDPNAPLAHNHLGVVLQDKGDLDGAVAAFTEAVRLDPKTALYQTYLQRVERWRQLLPRLREIAAGRAEPKTPAEALEFARLCGQPFQKRYALATRLYAGAFAADQKLADDVLGSHRYNAACYAALAAAGKDAERTTVGVEEWGHLTDRALRWLRADLAAWTARSKDRGAWPQVCAKMTHWKQDPDLVGVRDPAWLAAMPDSDRKRWEQLWADVDAVLAAVTPTVAPPPRTDSRP
jgi:tetratricopeptide (TPR) repeat protein